MIASLAAERDIDAMVVDVSMEVTALVRVLGIPTIVLAQPGLRDDEPHVLGRRLASRLIAPWPAGMHGPPPPGAVEVGGISRFAGRRRTREPEPGTVLVLGGRGGFELSRADLDAVREALPDHTVTVLGVAGAPWVDDPWDLLCGAEIVVAAAGQNSIADLAAVGARAIVIPQERPFEEQVTTARALDLHGLAVVAAAKPEAHDWPRLVAAARDLPADWSAWHVSGAAERAAAEIHAVALPARGSTAVITLCSAARLDHVERQAEALATADVVHIGVWLDAEPPPALHGMTMLHVPPGDHGLRLAAGRNTGAAKAIDLGLRLLVFLDADCVPGSRMLHRYQDASSRHPGALLCGPVTYLREEQTDLDPLSLDRMTAPHAARPAPPDGVNHLARADDYRLFWSLSFAVTASTWERAGGFHAEYQGYGAEDTDFGRAAREAGIPLLWVGGAHAYHQWHETGSPPWAHLDDILRNAAVFADRWGDTPMEGWIAAFAEAGVIESRDGRWVRRAESSLTGRPLLDSP